MRRLTLLTILIIPLSAEAQSECPGAHCSARAGQVNAVCIAQGQAGNLVFVENPPGSGEFCHCRCSCVPPQTPVAIADGKFAPIGSLKVGDSVLALGKDKKWATSKVVFSDGTKMPQRPLPYAIYLTVSNGASFVTTPDHTFLLPSDRLKRADRLAIGDELVDAKSLMPVKVTNVLSGEYLGPMHNIAATSWNDNDEQWGHLINTQGVVSGDYWTQLFLAESAKQTEPQIGSAAYLSSQKLAGTVIKRAPQMIQLGKDAKFTPHRPLAIPPDAIPFLPPGQDKAQPGALHPLDYTLPYEMAEYLTNLYRHFFPDITFQVSWTDDRVNAYAWMQGGRRYVAILGGLLRHRAIQQEGAGLVLAHEVGHHRGGAPRYPSGNTWASCEGQSDYWAATVGERVVWWGAAGIEQTKKGAQQLHDLFANGLMMNLLAAPQESDMTAPGATAIPPLGSRPVEALGACSHPPADCRLQTYLAGAALNPKPACAGDPPSVKTQ